MGDRSAFDPASIAGSTIAVSGSTSNLGAGFDALGLALDIELRLSVTRVVDDGAGALTCAFTTGPLQGQNAIERGFRRGLAAFAGHGCRVPSLTVEVASAIPMRAGLGSSAAALVAGLRLAERVVGPQPPGRLLTEACALEGHPDNTSASLLGGFVVAARHEDGTVIARTAAWPDDWHLVIATPQLELETKVARAALPSHVPLADAVYNVQRTALLVHAVHRHDAEAVRAAFGDRLHQAQRAALVPGLTEVLTWSDDHLLGTFLSGAGPSVAAVVDARDAAAPVRISRRFSALFAERGLGATVRTLRARPPHRG